MQQSVRQAGLKSVEAGLDIRAAFERATDHPLDAVPDGEVTEVAGKAFGDILPRTTFADLQDHFKAARPDLVIYEIGNIGAGLAGHVARIPTLVHNFGRVSPSPVTDVIVAATEKFAAELGVFRFSHPFLDICPASVQEPGFKIKNARILLRPVGWSDPGELPAIVRDRACPLVYLTLGTEFGDVGVLKRAIEGLARLPVEVLVSVGPAADVLALGGAPGNVHLEAWVPQAELLPHVDLVVHHGGSGTTLGAFGAGRPQLLLPQAADNFTNAEAVCAAGVGDRILPDDVTADVVYEQARRLLADEAAHDAARRLADEVAAMPSPDEVAARLPEYAKYGC